MATHKPRHTRADTAKFRLPSLFAGSQVWTVTVRDLESLLADIRSAGGNGDSTVEIRVGDGVIESVIPLQPLAVAVAARREREESGGRF